MCHNDTFSHETFQKGCKHVLNTRNVFTKVQSSYLGDLKNSALGHFWEIFLGGDGMGLLTSAENLEKFGKIWKIAKIQGGDRV